MNESRRAVAPLCYGVTVCCTDMVPLGAPALMRYRGRGDVAHTKVNTNAGETGFESWWTPLWCLWRPPALPEWFPLVCPFFSALEVAGGDHNLKGSQQSVVHH